MTALRVVPVYGYFLIEYVDVDLIVFPPYVRCFHCLFCLNVLPFFVRYYFFAHGLSHH